MHGQADVVDMTDVFALLVQLMTRFKESLSQLVEGVLPIAVGRVHALLGELCIQRIVSTCQTKQGSLKVQVSVKQNPVVC